MRPREEVRLEVVEVEEERLEIDDMFAALCCVVFDFFG